MNDGKSRSSIKSRASSGRSVLRAFLCFSGNGIRRSPSRLADGNLVSSDPYGSDETIFPGAPAIYNVPSMPVSKDRAGDDKIQQMSHNKLSSHSYCSNSRNESSINTADTSGATMEPQQEHVLDGGQATVNNSCIDEPDNKEVIAGPTPHHSQEYMLRSSIYSSEGYGACNGPTGGYSPSVCSSEAGRTGMRFDRTSHTSSIRSHGMPPKRNGPFPPPRNMMPPQNRGPPSVGFHYPSSARRGSGRRIRRTRPGSAVDPFLANNGYRQEYLPHMPRYENPMWYSEPQGNEASYRVRRDIAMSRGQPSPSPGAGWIPRPPSSASYSQDAYSVGESAYAERPASAAGQYFYKNDFSQYPVRPPSTTGQPLHPDPQANFIDNRKMPSWGPRPPLNPYGPPINQYNCGNRPIYPMKRTVDDDVRSVSTGCGSTNWGYSPGYSVGRRPNSAGCGYYSYPQPVEIDRRPMDFDGRSFHTRSRRSMSNIAPSNWSRATPNMQDIGYGPRPMTRPPRSHTRTRPPPQSHDTHSVGPMQRQQPG